MSDLFADDRVSRGDWPCPWCNEKNDTAAYLGVEARRPEPGDTGLCSTCAKPMIYQEHGKPRRPTESEWKKLNTDEGITAARKAIFMSNHGNINYRDMGIQVHNEDD